jgi:hypothetical protein
MFLNGVQLPDAVRFALEEDRLVIFVGAGASCPPPSNLPLFNGLAAEICGEPVEPGTEDRRLGEYKRKTGADVHALAAQILCNPATKHTDLHRHIVRVFRSPEKVRIVTTNFDDHFSAAAQKVFPKQQVREFHAPALPLGDDFSGLVYLHGSARMDSRALVLTQQDFGGAYLTRGWAKDFLVPLFSNFDVLFVGYSHTDVTMTYLASGLKRSDVKKRWAFVPSSISTDERNVWAPLDIDLVQYPIDPSNTVNSHQALTVFFGGWVKRQNESLLQKAKRVRTLARQLPPEGEVEKDYIAHCLSNNRLAEEFCQHIRHPAWIGWLEDNGYFGTCFNDGEVSPEPAPAHEWAMIDLLCSKTRQRHPEVLLDLLRKHNGKLSERFADLFAWHVWREQTKAPDPNFSTWVTILLSADDGRGARGYHAYLLSSCRLPQHLGVVLRLFEKLSTPHIKLKEAWSFLLEQEDPKGRRKTKTDFEIEWPASNDAGHYINEAWENVIEPHLPLIGRMLAPIIEKQLVQAHFLLRGMKAADGRYDGTTWLRSSIAAHPQNAGYFDGTISCLINMLRDIFLHLASEDAAWARMQADTWWRSDVPLLRRFAAYALSVDQQYSADERIEWALERDVIFRSGMKKEVFDVLASGYLSASPRIRRKLLRRIDRGDHGPGAKSLSADTLAYERFNVLVWLRRADTGCSLVQEAIAKIKADHPAFKERDHPDFDIWHGGGGARFIDPAEGFDFPTIIAKPPEDYLRQILNADENAVRRDRWDHLRNLASLYALDRDWGRRFIHALAESKNIDPEVKGQLWHGALSGWREIITTDDDWRWLFAILETLPREREIAAAAADLISAGIRKDNDSAFTFEMAEQAALFINHAWELCSAEKEKPDDAYKDWLASAINHVGGEIGQFWVEYCQRLRARDGANWQGIPSPLRENMVSALRGRNRTSAYARIAMTPSIGYIFAWDRSFAEEHLMPLFDWNRDPVVAQQTWSVFLCYGNRVPKEMELLLLPFYRQSAERCGQFDDETLRRFGYALARLVMDVVADPIERGFFRDFLPVVPREVRSAMANWMGEYFKAFDAERRREKWTSWLERYVDLRLIGVPIALDVSEAKHMAEWCVYLGEYFPKMVERILKMSLEGVFTHPIIDELLKRDIPKDFPREACLLTVAVLKAEHHPYFREELRTLYHQLKERIPGSTEIRALEELLFIRGWDKQ